MVGADHQHTLGVGEFCRGQPVAELYAKFTDDSHIHLAGADFTQQYLIAGEAEVDLGVGTGQTVLFDQLGSIPQLVCAGIANGKAGTVSASYLLSLCDCGLILRHELLTLSVIFLTCGGQSYTSFTTVEQLKSQLPFQLFDLLADGGLRNVMNFCGFGEVQMLCCRQKNG